MFNSEVINKGAFLFSNHAGILSPYEYTGYRKEVVASKTSAYVSTQLCISPVYDIKGPDAAKFMTSISVNDFTTTKVGGINHCILCNEKGQILTDGVVMKIAEDTFRCYWLSPVIDYYVSITDMDIVGTDLTGTEFFIQVAGPKSLEILENAGKCDLHDIGYVKHRMAKIADVDVRILRLGMSGTLAYELHGDMDKLEQVYSSIWEAAKPFGAKKLGSRAYCMNHTEGGFPNIYIHYPLPLQETPGIREYLEENPPHTTFHKRALLGSVGDDLEVRFRTPFDVGWGSRVKFNHDFPGKEALQKIAENQKTTLVTLEWNPDDIADIVASQFKGRDVEAYEPMDEYPTDYNYNPFMTEDEEDHYYYHHDKVMAGDKMVGVSAGRLNSIYYQRMISLGFIDKEFAKEGTELTVVWGSPGFPQKDVRVKVVQTPYVVMENNSIFDVEQIPRYKA
ncbi:aminomethyltransferase family protein [Acetobacterium sp. KB-1]|jgi:glycine cleavage system aminomethyltransferase T|uniref:aminomethyltransferase family protein n=1 Tax=Acetobacterium sp. KB-1 TaxID=2184575 RepID=UPI000DBEBB77|nr:aminomethyltransferase family protein [Acetobacterium sp. KB-1]AWW25871.1 aminomethyl transferase family protein [Acetobacterium sp. KB-1]